MIPTGGTVTQNTQTVEQPSKTWRLDLDRGRVVGTIDGINAVQQAVIKILQTERFQHLIYDANYGAEFAGLIGHEPVFIQSELRRRIREALMQDDRITDVVNYQIVTDGDTATITFTVVSTMGSFEQEVSVNV